MADAARRVGAREGPAGEGAEGTVLTAAEGGDDAPVAEGKELEAVAASTKRPVEGAQRVAVSAVFPPNLNEADYQALLSKLAAYIAAWEAQVTRWRGEVDRGQYDAASPRFERAENDACLLLLEWLFRDKPNSRSIELLSDS